MNTLLKTKFLILLVLLSILFTSCSKDEGEEFRVNTTRLYFDAIQSSKSQVITVDGSDWNVEVQDEYKSWLLAVKENGTLYVNVKNNLTRTPRQGTVIVSSGGTQQTIDVVQKEMQAKLEFSIENPITIFSGTEELSFEVTSNLVYEVIKPEGTDWINKVKETVISSDGIYSTKQFVYSLTKNLGEDERSVELIFKEKDGVYSENLKIYQKAPLDIKIPVASGSASSFQSGSEGEGPIELAFDGDMNTIYHSLWDNSTNYFPIDLDFNFENQDQIDYLIYYPRKSDNGLFKQVEIWVATKENATLTKIMDYDFNATKEKTKVSFLNPVKNPTTIRIKVISGVNNFASCAEMEFYKRKFN